MSAKYFWVNSSQTKEQAYDKAREFFRRVFGFYHDSNFVQGVVEKNPVFDYN